MAREPRRSGTTGSKIHEGLTGARELVGTNYLAKNSLRAEYEKEIAPRTAAALTRILQQTFPSAASERPSPPLRRAIDLGSGTGAAGSALRAHFGVTFDLVSVDSHVKGAGIRNLDVTSPSAIASLGRQHDLVVAAHVLNELLLDVLPDERIVQMVRIVRHWFDSLCADDGTMILLEPALRDTSRTLLKVRDGLIAGGLHVIAPCFLQAPCPALAIDRDWCHDSVVAEKGRRVDFSYLVLRKSQTEVVDPFLVRIVSDALPEKGKIRFFACGSAGRVATIRLDKNKTKANADFSKLKRGDVARIERASPASDGIRIAADTRVDRLPRANDLS